MPLPVVKFGGACFHKLGKSKRGFYRLLASLSHYRARDFLCKALFAVLEQDFYEFVLRVAVYDVVGGHSAALVHSHVELSVEAVGKSAFGVIYLVGRNS